MATCCKCFNVVFFRAPQIHCLIWQHCSCSISPTACKPLRKYLTKLSKHAAAQDCTRAIKQIFGSWDSWSKVNVRQLMIFAGIPWGNQLLSEETLTTSCKDSMKENQFSPKHHSLVLTSWCRSEKSCSLVFPWLCWPQHSPLPPPGATAAPLVDKFHILRSMDRPRLVLLELREHEHSSSLLNLGLFLIVTFSVCVTTRRTIERLVEDMEITAPCNL